MEVEELTEWRYGGLGHLGIFFFLILLVGTWSSINGIGTGYTTSGNRVNSTWRLPVRPKVTLDIQISCLTYGSYESVCGMIHCFHSSIWTSDPSCSAQKQGHDVMALSSMHR
jgi:hypothetical protein